jgi:hypothetical protein
MSRTIRNSWSWQQSQDGWKAHRDQGCGGKCWCKADRKARPPARDRRRMLQEIDD